MRERSFSITIRKTGLPERGERDEFIKENTHWPCGHESLDRKPRPCAEAILTCILFLAVRKVKCQREGLGSLASQAHLLQKLPQVCSSQNRAQSSAGRAKTGKEGVRHVHPCT